MSLKFRVFSTKTDLFNSQLPFSTIDFPSMAERLHAIIKAKLRGLSAKTWYGIPAYAKDGTLVCFFQSAQKFKTRYATLGFKDEAKLDEGDMMLANCLCIRRTHGIRKMLTQTNARSSPLSSFSSDRDQWMHSQCINIHDPQSRVYELAGEYAGRRAVSMNFFMLLESYQNHPEAKSLGPDGKPCKFDTRGLLHLAAKTPG